MAKIEKSARETVATATEAVNTAAEAVKVGRKAVRMAKKAGSQAKVVGKQVVDRVTGREAERRRKGMAIAGAITGAAVITGVAVARMKKTRKR